MTKGDIMYGDINVTLVKARKQRGTNKVIDFDRHNYRMNKIVFTMHNGKVIQKAGVLNERIQRNLPHHFQNHEVTQITFLQGDKVGETAYDIEKLI